MRHSDNFVRETGRSMIEMLGVLAIVGLLSVGGITGFTAAMNKHYANEILEGGRVRVTTIMGQVLIHQPPSLSEFKDNVYGGGTFGTEIVTSGLNGKVGIEVSKVKKQVCKNILNSIGDRTDISWLSLPENPGVAITDCDEENTYLLVFSTASYVSSQNNPESGTPTPPEEDPPAVTCESDIVKINNCDGSVSDCCPDNGNQCVQPTECCFIDSACKGTGTVCINNVCTCPDGWFRNTNKNCTNCSNAASKEAPEEECAKCDKFGFHREMQGKMCTFSGNCPSGYFKGKSGTDTLCLSCTDYNAYVPDSTNECNKCNTPEKTLRAMVGKNCTLVDCPSGTFKSTDGLCHSCTATGRYETAPGECGNKCANSTPSRIVASNGETEYCGICSAGTFYQTDYMVCRSCSSTDTYVSTEQACAACDSTDYPRHIVNGRCERKNCADGYFKSNTETCTACSYKYLVTPYDDNECSKCNDTETPRQMLNGKCAPTVCPSGYFLQSDGNCQVCSNANPQKASSLECAKCDTTETPREMVGDFCVLKNGSCPSGQFYEISEKGMWCQNCSNTKPFASTKTECDKCAGTGSEREMSGDYCIIPCTDGKIRDSSGGCRTCGTTDTYTAPASECAKCDSTSTPRIILDNGKCALSCASGYFRGQSGGTCIDCSDKNRQIAYNSDECTQCNSGVATPLRKIVGNYCDPVCPFGWFQNANGNCTICSNTAAKETSDEECKKCENTGYPRDLDDKNMCRLRK